MDHQYQKYTKVKHLKMWNLKLESDFYPQVLEVEIQSFTYTLL